MDTNFLSLRVWVGSYSLMASIHLHLNRFSSNRRMLNQAVSTLFHYGFICVASYITILLVCKLSWRVLIEDLRWLPYFSFQPKSPGFVKSIVTYINYVVLCWKTRICLYSPWEKLLLEHELFVKFFRSFFCLLQSICQWKCIFFL